MEEVSDDFVLLLYNNLEFANSFKDKLSKYLSYELNLQLNETKNEGNSKSKWIRESKGVAKAKAKAEANAKIDIFYFLIQRKKI
jgi:hypothetical protein